jgi:hypothetical protein
MGMDRELLANGKDRFRVRFGRVHFSCTEDDIKQTVHGKMRKNGFCIFSLVIGG